MDRIRSGVDKGELQDTELSFFKDNLVFKIIFNKGSPNRPLLFETVLKLHGIHT